MFVLVAQSKNEKKKKTRGSKHAHFWSCRVSPFLFANLYRTITTASGFILFLLLDLRERSVSSEATQTVRVWLTNSSSFLSPHGPPLSFTYTNLATMAPLLVMRIRLLEVPRRFESLSTTRPQIQCVHYLLDIVVLIDLGLDIGLTTPTLLGVQDSPVPVVRGKEDLGANDARVPNAVAGAGAGASGTREAADDVSGFILAVRCRV